MAQTWHGLRCMLINKEHLWASLCQDRDISQRGKFKDGLGQEGNMFFHHDKYKIDFYNLLIFIIKSGNVSHMKIFYRIPTFRKFNWNCSTKAKYLMYFTSSLKIFKLTPNKSVVRTWHWQKSLTCDIDIRKVSAT